jgi:hypothetical protein
MPGCFEHNRQFGPDSSDTVSLADYEKNLNGTMPARLVGINHRFRGRSYYAIVHSEWTGDESTKARASSVRRLSPGSGIKARTEGEADELYRIFLIQVPEIFPAWFQIIA